MRNVLIRRAEKIDANLVAEISRETFFDTFAEHNTKADMDKFLSEQFSVQQLMDEVNVAENIFFLAYAGTEPAGYVFLKNISTDKSLADSVEISRLYARKQFIGEGIGRALMNKAIETAKELTKKKIWLGVWEHNQRAIRFYESFGFIKTGEQAFLLGNDLQRDWKMECVLSSEGNNK